MHRPRWRIPDDGRDLVLVPWGSEPATDAKRLGPRDARATIERLARIAESPGIGAALLADAARYLGQRHGLAVGFGAADARTVLTECLARGLLTVWSAPSRRGTASLRDDLDAGLGEATPATGAEEPRTWIEIELVDMEGNPRPGERYWIKLPDGRVREGALDALGRAYFGDLDPGECDVRWPDLDADATIESPRAVSRPTERERSWIEIELLDMEGKPRVGERYWVKTPDGRVLQGRLNGEGRAHLHDLDPGVCEIRWPELDAEAALAVADPTALEAEDHGDLTLTPPRRAPGVAPPDEDDEPAFAPGSRRAVDVAAQVAALEAAARAGRPFCEECARAG